MAITLQAHGSGLTSVTLNSTTGSPNLIIIAVSCQNTGTVISESGVTANTWTPLTLFGGNDGTNFRPGAQFFYSFNPNTGASHVFNASGGSASAMVVACFSGVASNPFDQQNGIANQATVTAIGSVTPSTAQNHELVIVVVGDASTTAPTISGFTSMNFVAYVSGTNYAITVVYQVQTTLTTVNPTWSGASSGSATVATFRSQVDPRFLQALTGSMATMAGAIAEARRRAQALTASMATMAGAMKRGRLLAASAATMAGAVSTIRKRVAGAFTASMATMSATILRGRIIGASLMTFAGGISNRTGKVLSGSMATFAGALARLQGRALAASMATMAAVLARAKAGTQSFSASMATMSGALLRGWAFAASMATMNGLLAKKTLLHGFAATMATFAAALSAAKAGGVIMTASMATFAGAIVKMTKKIFNAS